LKRTIQILFLFLISNCLSAQKISGYLLGINEQEALFINIGESWGKYNCYNLCIENDIIPFTTDTSGYFEVTLQKEMFEKIISNNKISIKSMGINFLITNFSYSDTLIRLPGIINCSYIPAIEDHWFSEQTTLKQLKDKYSKVKKFSKDSLYYVSGKYKVRENKFLEQGEKFSLYKNGVWKIFLTKGNVLLKKCNFKNACLNGAYLEYDNKKNKMIKGRFKNGQMKGHWKVLNNLTDRYYDVFKVKDVIIFDLK